MVRPVVRAGRGAEGQKPPLSCPGWGLGAETTEDPLGLVVPCAPH